MLRLQATLDIFGDDATPRMLLFINELLGPMGRSVINTVVLTELSRVQHVSRIELHSVQDKNVIDGESILQPYIEVGMVVIV